MSSLVFVAGTAQITSKVIPIDPPSICCEVNQQEKISFHKVLTKLWCWVEKIVCMLYVVTFKFKDYSKGSLYSLLSTISTTQYQLLYLVFSSVYICNYCMRKKNIVSNNVRLSARVSFPTKANGAPAGRLDAEIIT